MTSAMKASLTMGTMRQHDGEFNSSVRSNPHSSVGSSWLDWEQEEDASDDFGLLTGPLYPDAMEADNSGGRDSAPKVPRRSNEGMGILKAKEEDTEVTATVTKDNGAVITFTTTKNDDKNHRGDERIKESLNMSLNMSNTSATSTRGRTAEELEALSMNVEKTTKRTQFLALLVVLIGAAASSAFLALGITGAQQDASDSFQIRAQKFATELTTSWRDYETAALWIHDSCRNFREVDYTHDDFELLYQYIIRMPLEFYAMEWVPNITHAERAFYEDEGRIGWAAQAETMNEEWYLGDHPELEKQAFHDYNYTGFMGLEPNKHPEQQLIYTERSEQPFYFPIHFAEPTRTNLDVAHYDLYSSPPEKRAIDQSLQTGEPALSEPFMLQGEASEEGYSVVFYHPGPNFAVSPYQKYAEIEPRDLAAMVIHIQSLLKRAASFNSGINENQLLQVYLFDKTNAKNEPAFMSALEMIMETEGGDNTIPLPERSFSSFTQNHDDFYFEQDFPVGGRTWVTVVIPVEGTTDTQPEFIIFGGVLLFLASLLLAAWMIHNMHQSIRIHRVMTKAAAEASIVSEMFPANIRERLIEEAEEKNQMTKYNKHGIKASSGHASPSQDGMGGKKQPASLERTEELSEMPRDPGDLIFGTKPIADLHPYTTVVRSNLCGFTAWASVRTPAQVFNLLEVVYHSFDASAKKLGVFKVETVGDHYLAVAGLPKPRRDHAVVMAKFATECSIRVQRIVKSLEKTLGPETSEIGCRFGLHSGQVIAGVLRGDKGRFQLFGDTIIKMEVMEASGIRDKIQVSAETAELLEKAGHSEWLIRREESILMNGKPIPSYFLHISRKTMDVTKGPASVPRTILVDDKTNRLVEWNVEALSGFLRGIVARRNLARQEGPINSPSAEYREPAKLRSSGTSGMVLDEVKEVIMLPRFNAQAARNQVDPSAVQLDPAVVEELHNLITVIAAHYRDNPFHSFEHASHTTMSVIKMMERIVNPREIEAKKQNRRFSNDYRLEAALHDHTFGITSDPLTQFSCVFAALIHDLDHPGVPNTTLVNEKSPLASNYRNKSVSEQHSVDLAWELLMKPDYKKLRNCLCCNDDEFARFRSLVVNSVMATDLMDKDLGAARKHRWHKAFSKEEDWAGQQEGQLVKVNRKATIVIEHLIQASDVSHTMQHWHVYTKWNERLFHELYKAYMEGRSKTDPTYAWYDGELGFFDHYVIPLAKKLFTCGVFGVSSDEFLNYAMNNRKEWAARGEQAIKQYLETYEERYGI